MENKFVDGLFVNDKKNAPDFINAKLGITPKFIEYYNNNCDAKGNLRIDIKTAKSGKQYAEKDNWKPESANNYSQPTPESTGLPPINAYGEEMVEDLGESEISVKDLPF